MSRLGVSTSNGTDGRSRPEEEWRQTLSLEDAVRKFAEANGLKLGQVAQPLRVALTGSTASPGIFEVLAALGPAAEKALGRRRFVLVYLAFANTAPIVMAALGRKTEFNRTPKTGA